MDNALLRQRQLREVKQRLIVGDIDMHRTATAGSQHRLIGHAVAVPACEVIMRLDEIHILKCEARQSTRLVDGLAHLLSDVCHGTVSTDDHQRQTAVTSLGD